MVLSRDLVADLARIRYQKSERSDIPWWDMEEEKKREEFCMERIVPL
jgi:hypothetical protein